MGSSRRFLTRCREFGVVFTIKQIVLRKLRNKKPYIDITTRYLERFFKAELESFDGSMREAIPTSDEQRVKYVFMCWWQGESRMPALCKACYEKLKQVVRDEYQLILITEENYSKYATIHEEILKKFKSGQISIVMFSDILRQALIVQNGGIWIDATVWTNEKILSHIECIQDFWSVKLEDIYNPNGLGQTISSCQWSGFIIGGHKDSPFFALSNKLMRKYFETYSIPIDYFLQNFIFKIIFENTEYGRSLLRDLEPSNPELYTLQSILDEKYSPDVYNALNNTTGFFKLNYKTQYHEKKEGDITFYKYIIDYMANRNESAVQ